jgi:hypothetical protein
VADELVLRAEAVAEPEVALVPDDHALHAEVRGLERADEVRPLPPVDEAEERAAVGEQRVGAAATARSSHTNPTVVIWSRSSGRSAKRPARSIAPLLDLLASVRVPEAYGGSVTTASTGRQVGDHVERVAVVDRHGAVVVVGLTTGMSVGRASPSA